MKFKIIFYVLIAFTLSSCAQNGTEQKFTKNGKTVFLKFDTDKDYLEFEKPTNLKVVFENIELNNIMILGPGIRITGGGNNFMKCEVTVYKKYISEGNLEILIKIFDEKTEKHELFNKFLIPAK